MAITEGVGIAAAGKEARAKALAKSKQVTSDKKIAAEYKVDPFDKILRDIDRNFKRIGSQESTGGVKETGRGMGDTFDPSKDFQVKRRGGYFSPDGGAFDERNNVEVASSDLSSLRRDDTTESTFGKSFTEQASANLADASIYKKKEDTIYRPTDSIYDSLKDTKFPKIEKDTGYGESIEKSLSELSDTSKSIFGIDEKTKEYGVPMSKEEKKVTTVYEMMNLPFPFKSERYKFSDTNYDKIQSDYDKYKDLRDRRQTRKEAEETVTKFRKDYMKDFYDADYAIKMQRYNLDGTENELNKYNLTRDQYLKGLQTDLRDYNEMTAMSGEGVNNAMDRYGNIMTSKEKREFEQKVDNEEQERIRLSKLKVKKDYEDSQKNIFQKVGDFIGRVTRPPAALGAENTLSRTVPSGSFNISQEGKDQAAINRGIKAAEATGIPTGVAAQGGVTTQAARDAGVKARQEAADKRAKNMADAQGIAARNPNVSIVGGKAVAANDSGRARAQAAAVNRKIQGKTVSQVKAENKKSMQDAARKRNEAFKKAKEQKKKSGGGFGKSTSTTKKSTTKKSSPSKSSKSKSSTSSAGPGSARGKAAAKGRTKKSKSKSSSSKSSSSKSSKSKSSSSSAGSARGKAAAKGRTRRRKSSRGKRCDIRCKYNIMPLTNMNLIKDDLAEVAYFVKELQA